MRTYGRIYDEDGNATWVKVETTADGDNTLVWLVTLIQVLYLQRNESPFYANYGIPAQLAVLSATPPDIYVVQTQQQFAPYFGSLLVSKLGDRPPTYRVAATSKTGASIQEPIPQ